MTSMIVTNSKTIKSQVVCNSTTIDNAMNYMKNKQQPRIYQHSHNSFIHTFLNDTFNIAYSIVARPNGLIDRNICRNF